MQFLRLFFKRIIDDLKQKKLIPLKILFFVHASTLFVLYPYLTIHMRELGIDVEETAVMSAVTPVVSIVMPPLAGMLADKIGNFREDGVLLFSDVFRQFHDTQAVAKAIQRSVDSMLAKMGSTFPSWLRPEPRDCMSVEHERAYHNTKIYHERTSELCCDQHGCSTTWANSTDECPLSHMARTRSSSFRSTSSISSFTPPSAHSLLHQLIHPSIRYSIPNLEAGILMTLAWHDDFSEIATNHGGR
ncbi:hypothetical protein EVAR_46602_1 [Eumeta japonica]|uniref:Major facilitator superfamily associated domain-containing protein n=1 Tax=Eumeta variegata TaxID=151549 RepID=A0A4C1Z9I5_EUMVA|nr:hypothetical protein EVAR_46602_1 [Eumeta japonica]